MCYFVLICFALNYLFCDMLSPHSFENLNSSFFLIFHFHSAHVRKFVSCLREEAAFVCSVFFMVQTEAFIMRFFIFNYKCAFQMYIAPRDTMTNWCCALFF
eukprot:GEMP01056498.1.p1 GENE.GEMP01056498.1~~GEMP01056498.1.p1  ORF type:complete len:101 (+),score=1.84 GEMP01056498.1:1198-1500(+)